MVIASQWQTKIVMRRSRDVWMYRKAYQRVENLMLEDRIRVSIHSDGTYKKARERDRTST